MLIQRELIRLPLLLLTIILGTSAEAQFASWSKPLPAFRVVGNLYAVGGYDLSVYLVTSEAGHILINTGLEDSTSMIRANIESLGYRLEDVKILLTQQAHWDHTAALAEIKALTGAELWATADDAPLLEDGGFSDPQFGGRQTFRPVAVDRIIANGEVIRLGDTRLTVHEHPGHTAGAASYGMTVNENGRDYRVLIANLGTINEGKRLLNDPTYPGVADDFATTYRQQLAMAVDIWVAAHASQYGLHEKWQPGDDYDPERFVDPDGLRGAVAELQEVYLAQLALERAEADGLR